jgi:hypothetical protein
MNNFEAADIVERLFRRTIFKTPLFRKGVFHLQTPSDRMNLSTFCAYS